MMDNAIKCLDKAICPFCGGDLVKAGKHYNKDGEIQRYLCRDCRRTTTKPKQVEDIG